MLRAKLTFSEARYLDKATEISELPRSNMCNTPQYLKYTDTHQPPSSHNLTRSNGLRYPGERGSFFPELVETWGELSFSAPVSARVVLS